MRAPARRAGERRRAAGFAYTDFGTPGTVVSRHARAAARHPHAARSPTASGSTSSAPSCESDRVLVQLSIDGGEMLDTRDNPLATAMTERAAAGGLGKHSQDELQSILAGRSVSASAFGADERDVRRRARRPPRAISNCSCSCSPPRLTDPGYRAGGRGAVPAQHRQLLRRSCDATPDSALGNTLGGILSDDDPRFTLQPSRGLPGADLRQAARRDIGDRLASGAIEMALVGDIDEDAGDRAGRARRSARCPRASPSSAPTPSNAPAPLHRRPQPARDRATTARPTRRSCG